MSDDKYDAELKYWKDRHSIEGKLANKHYEELMLRLSGKDKSFFDGKVIGDFGCGPRGSLEWADGAAERYCIDVLVDEYEKLGIRDHAATYVKSSEDGIPLQDEVLDILFCVNSIDHVNDLEKMTDECFRIVKPGGWMFFSINLDEPPSPAEPNTITMQTCQDIFISRLQDVSKMTSNRFKGANKYQYLYDWGMSGTKPPEYNGHWGILWLRGRKI